MEALNYATLVGLVLDVFGFLLIVRYGHSLFLRVGAGAPRENEGKDGDFFLEIAGADDRGDRQRRRKAHVGVATVVVGFSLQIVGTIPNLPLPI